MTWNWARLAAIHVCSPQAIHSRASAFGANGIVESAKRLFRNQQVTLFSADLMHNWLSCNPVQSASGVFCSSHAPQRGAHREASPVLQNVNSLRFTSTNEAFRDIFLGCHCSPIQSPGGQLCRLAAAFRRSPHNPRRLCVEARKVEEWNWNPPTCREEACPNNGKAIQRPVKLMPIVEPIEGL